MLFSARKHTLDSIIYRMEPSTKRFIVYQNISTTGAYDWTHMEMDGYHFLAVANTYTETPTTSTRINSVLYFWHEGKFIQFQEIPVINYC